MSLAKALIFAATLLSVPAELTSADQTPVKASEVTGLILNGFNSGVPGIRVIASGQIAGVVHEAEAISNGTGSYGMLLPQGEWTFSVHCADLQKMNFRCPAEQFVSITASSSLGASFTLLPATRMEISGRVVDQDGAPLAGVSLGARHLTQRFTIETTTGDDGAFAFDLPGGGEWWVSTRTSRVGEVSPSVSLNVATGVSFTGIDFRFLRIDGVITGSVRDGNGAAVSAVPVRARAGTTAVYTLNARTDVKGNYSMTVPSIPGWEVYANCDGLIPIGYACFPAQNVDVSNATARVDFTVEALPPPAREPRFTALYILKTPAGRPVSFNFRFEGESRPYDVLVSRSLPFAWSVVQTVFIPFGESSATGSVGFEGVEFFRLQAR